MWPVSGPLWPNSPNHIGDNDEISSLGVRPSIFDDFLVPVAKGAVVGSKKSKQNAKLNPFFVESPESKIASPLPVTPGKENQRTLRTLVPGEARQDSKSSFLFEKFFGTQDSKQAHAPKHTYLSRRPNRLISNRWTSSPISGREIKNISFNISAIKGPEATIPVKADVEPEPESTMPRIVTITKKSENGTKASQRPCEDFDRVSDGNEEGELSSDGDDDVILVEDDGKETRLKLYQEDEDRVSPGSKDYIQLCEYHRQNVTSHDYKTLADEEFLNDAIVNFYLTFLYEQLSPDLKEAIHIFSSHFYSRLKGQSRSKSKQKESPLMTQAEKSYMRVKSWTRKIDIFEKRMLIVPICEDCHWYLVIVCNPGMVLSAKRTRNFEEKRKEQEKLEPQGSNPFIMVLDSLGGTHSSAVSKIRSYLQFEHMERKKIPLNFGREKMNEKQPMIPLQPNSCDCGIFLLHYVELIFKDPAKFLGNKLPDLSQWFSSKEIDFKREDIAVLIQELAIEQKKENESLPKFPHIKFPARRPRSSTPDIATAEPTSHRNSDPRLRKKAIQGSFPLSGPVRTIRITKSPLKDAKFEPESQKTEPNSFASSSSTPTKKDERSTYDEERTEKSKLKSPVPRKKVPLDFIGKNDVINRYEKYERKESTSYGRKDEQKEAKNRKSDRKYSNEQKSEQNDQRNSKDRKSEQNDRTDSKDRKSEQNDRRDSKDRKSEQSDRRDLKDRTSKDRKDSKDQKSLQIDRKSEQSDRKRVRNDTSDQILDRHESRHFGDSDDIIFIRSPAESAKRRSQNSSSPWKTIGSHSKEESDEPLKPKKRFKIHRDAYHAASKANNKSIGSANDMFQELMKYTKK